jgi:Cd2+/Zn2+-exporting ATPase
VLSEHKNEIINLIVGSMLFVAAIIAAQLAELSIWVKLAVFLVPYLVLGGGVLLRAARNIVNGQIFDENFLMCVATVGAFALGEYTEGVAVMLFYRVGELFEDIAVNRSRRSIADLMDIRPDYAWVERSGIEKVRPEEVAVGETIVVRVGERVPLDGKIIEGGTQLDTAALTGESLPRDAGAGDEILSGSVNLSGVVRVRVTKPYGESTVSRILELVENSGDKKAKVENFITRFARYYTPIVCALALALAIVPPLIFGQMWGVWVQRGLIFLVVSCPCALVISVPMSFFGGIGGASKQGVLIKGSNYLEVLSKADTIVFDKTGTLTSGSFEVVAVHPETLGKNRLLELAAYAESMSDHPIGRSIIKAYGVKIDHSRITGMHETGGHGVEAVVDGLTVLAGNAVLMDLSGVGYHECHLTGTTVHIAVNGQYEGHIIISDRLKDDAPQAVKTLKSLGVSKAVMLTGDIKPVAEAVAGELGLDEFYAQLLPQGKVEALERLLNEKRHNTSLVFVGDGINDAPVLARADVGIAMGALGSDAAIEAADVVLMDDRPSAVAVAVRIARGTMRIVRQNIWFALSVKFAILILATVGIANMWLAVFADVGVAFIAILNAARCLKLK